MSKCCGVSTPSSSDEQTTIALMTTPIASLRYGNAETDNATGVEQLAKALRTSAASLGLGVHVMCAALTDYLRALHEIFYKSGLNQSVLLTQVQNCFGKFAANHLWRVIGPSNLKQSYHPIASDCSLQAVFNRLCAERGIPEKVGITLISQFHKSLDEARYVASGNCESPLFMTYRTVGDEAAYHLGCLLVGDDHGEAMVELEMLDYRLKRFSTFCRRWDMELEWDKLEAGLISDQ
jgi:hypothetical protein